MIKYGNINNEKMKKINLKVVLDTIRQMEPISRKELADVIGLTSASITNIVNRLINDGFLIETGSRESNGGRKPIMLELNSTARYAIGVELNVSNIICLITDFKAKKIAKNECKTLVKEGKDKIIERIINIINKTINDAGIQDKDKIMGIGLVSAGPYDHQKGIMVNPPNFPGWYNVPIKDIIQNATGIPTFFEKETVSMALAEYLFGCASEVNSLFCAYINNIGIGGGVIIDGRIYHGFCDGAGDIGHMVIDLDGPACNCGNFGCLETVASGLAIVRNVKSEIRRGEASLVQEYVRDIDDIDIHMVIEAANRGDGLCRRMIEKSARYMGIALSNIINVYSPEMIVVGGELPQSCPSYADITIEYARKRSYPLYNKDVKILPASLGTEQGAMGGVGIVFQEFYKRIYDK